MLTRVRPGPTIPDVDVAYNEGQAPLEALLQSIDRPGDYCTQGRLFVPMPRVEVAGAGVLSFPVTPPHAQALISVADRAPYGRGEQTPVDSSVRACWQIDAAQVTVTGAVWRDTRLRQGPGVAGRTATGRSARRRRAGRPAGQRDRQRSNEGVELSHSYRRAALVVWPLRQTVRTLAHGGIGGALAYVADELARTDEATGHARALVAQLVDSWPAPVRSYQYRPSEPPDAAGSCTDSLRLLRRLGDEATTRRFLHEILTAHYSGEENAELLETAATLSPVTLHAHLAR